MSLVRLNLIGNDRGPRVLGEPLLLDPAQIESVRPYPKPRRWQMLFRCGIGSMVTLKNGDRYHVTACLDEMANLLETAEQSKELEIEYEFNWTPVPPVKAGTP